ncbi:NAD(P)-dependent oxidoreductase [Streptomyces sp. NBC_01571]|uniref:NAD(P)-dependent oxidoreductase n=1 Tax=Streptomyces sp. NBC_01571 TaxID=2975883 RepID=UPI00225475F4|nr:NAD(P)-dependent oxidoreductase [Streptomyces sp. NBC_01571]MCX4571832.1 NAD(P)-dependent oxidoreductase [Streptomyces sp. NBC_01571]
MSTICMIGVGRMGEPLCAGLVRAGYRVRACDVLAERREAALSHGALAPDSAAAAAAGADVLLTVLPGPVEVAAAVDDAVLGALAPQATWIDMSSNTPTGAEPCWKRAAAHGVGVREAPIGGSPADAAAARLRVFVGGEDTLLERHRPLLSAVSDRITHVGGPGTGYVAKLLVNLLWFGQAAATAEALLLGRRAGIDLGVLTETLAAGPASTAFIRHDLPALLAGDYLTDFGLDHIHDQLTAVTALAEQLATPHSVADTVRRLHAEALERYGPADGELLAVALLEEKAGILLRHPATAAADGDTDAAEWRTERHK